MNLILILQTFYNEKPTKLWGSKMYTEKNEYT